MTAPAIFCRACGQEELVSLPPGSDNPERAKKRLLKQCPYNIIVLRIPPLTDRPCDLGYRAGIVHGERPRGRGDQ